MLSMRLGLKTSRSTFISMRFNARSCYRGQTGGVSPSLRCYPRACGCVQVGVCGRQLLRLQGGTRVGEEVLPPRRVLAEPSPPTDAHLGQALGGIPDQFLGRQFQCGFLHWVRQAWNHCVFKF